MNLLALAVVSTGTLVLGMAGARTDAATPAAPKPAAPSSVYDFTVTGIDGDDVKLENYKGDVLLIVNVASK